MPSPGTAMIVDYENSKNGIELANKFSRHTSIESNNIDSDGLQTTLKKE